MRMGTLRQICEFGRVTAQAVELVDQQAVRITAPGGSVEPVECGLELGRLRLLALRPASTCHSTSQPCASA